MIVARTNPQRILSPLPFVHARSLASAEALFSACLSLSPFIVVHHRSSALASKLASTLIPFRASPLARLTLLHRASCPPRGYAPIPDATSSERANTEVETTPHESFLIARARNPYCSVGSLVLRIGEETQLVLLAEPFDAR